MAVRVAVSRAWFVAFGVVALFVAVAFLSPLRAHAATLIVDTTNDTITGGQCSLRGAIIAVNA